MAKKSKGFSELLREKRRKQQRYQKPLKSLEKKLKHGPFPGDKLIVAPPGAVKMSEVLEDFVEPYRHLVETEEGIKKLLALGIVAWNTALQPKSEWSQIVDEVLTDKLFEGDQAMKVEVRDLVSKLIDRKIRHFSECQRTILNFELEDTGSGYALSVASTMSESDFDLS